MLRGEIKLSPWFHGNAVCETTVLVERGAADTVTSVTSVSPQFLCQGFLNHLVIAISLRRVCRSFYPFSVSTMTLWCFVHIVLVGVFSFLYMHVESLYARGTDVPWPP